MGADRNTWIRKNTPALTISAILFIIGLSWLIPPQENFFVIQRRLQELWIVLLGITGIPFYVTVLDNPAAALLIMLICSLLLAFISQYLWSKGWKGIVLLVAIFAINTFIGAAMLQFGFGDGSLTSTVATVECQATDIQGAGIRLVSYAQQFADGSFRQYFFSSTQDDGKNWNQIGSVAYETPLSGCKKRHRYGNTDFNFYTCLPEKDAHPAWICLENVASP
jgi:hypothetical protein